MTSTFFERRYAGVLWDLCHIQVALHHPSRACGARSVRSIGVAEPRSTHRLSIPSNRPLFERPSVSRGDVFKSTPRAINHWGESASPGHNAA